MATPVNCSALSDPSLCEVLESAGGGIGQFLYYLGLSLPYFLILIGIVGGIVGIIWGVAYLVQHSMSVRRK